MINRRTFIAALLASAAFSTSAQAWLRHGAAPALPQWPSPGPGTNYYVAANGNDSNDGLTTSTPWLTCAKVNAQGAGTKTFNFRGGDNFNTPTNDSLIFKSNWTFQSVNVNRATITPVGTSTFATIYANAVSNVSLLGMATINNGTRHGVGGYNAVPNYTISGCNIAGVESVLFLGTDFTGLRIGGVISSDARGGVVDNIIGGSSPTDNTTNNGISFYGSAITESSYPCVRIAGNLIRNEGGQANAPAASTGNGIHVNQCFGTGGRQAFTLGTDGEPTNALMKISGNVITCCGANTNTCGGPSGILGGAADRLWSCDNEISFIGPIGSFMGYISGTTLTLTSPALGMPPANGLVVIGAGTLANNSTTISSGSGSTWTVNVSQTVGSVGSPVQLWVIPSNQAGCDWVGGDIADIAVTHAIAEREYCHDCYGPGIITFGSSAPWGPVTIRYCLIVNCNPKIQEGSLAVQGNSGTGFHYVYNNTVICMPAVGFSAQALMFYNDGLLSGFCVNNIIMPYPGDTHILAVQGTVVPISSTFTIANNDFVSNARGYQWPNGGSIYATLALWKAAGGGSDQTAIQADPGFVGGAGTAAYKLASTGSPCYQAGVDITQAPYSQTPAPDFFGAVWSSGASNIGCDAYGNP